MLRIAAMADAEESLSLEDLMERRDLERLNRLRPKFDDFPSSTGSSYADGTGSFTFPGLRYATGTFPVSNQWQTRRTTGFYRGPRERT